MDSIIVEKNSRSLFAKHLKILELDGGELTDLNVEQEKAVIAGLSLPPLRLPASTRPRSSIPVWARYGAGFAAAACLLVVVGLSLRKTEPDFAVKGESRIGIYYKHGAEVIRLDLDQALPADSQFRVEVNAAQTGKAYLFFFDEKGELLVPVEKSRATAISVSPGVKVTFPGSDKLTGASVGERAVVCICSQSSVGKFDALSNAELAMSLKTALRDSAGHMDVTDCRVLTRKLR